MAVKKYKKWLLALLVLALAGAGIAWYLFTLKFDDTATVKADYTVNAMDFLKEFRKDLAGSNKKYAEKIVLVNGTVSAVEMADTTANIKMVDAASGDYIIFAFQQAHLPEAKAMKEGEKVSIKGSCSNAVFSEILGIQKVDLIRCAVNK